MVKSPYRREQITSTVATGGGALGKYEPLRDYLAGLSGHEESMTFAQLEQLVGPLPDSAREHRAWWGNDDYKSPVASLAGCGLARRCR